MSNDNLPIYVILPGKDLIPENLWPNTDASVLATWKRGRKLLVGGGLCAGSFFLGRGGGFRGGGVGRGGLQNHDVQATVILLYVQCL